MKSTMKKEFIAWVSKDVPIDEAFNTIGNELHFLYPVWTNKGKKDSWASQCWPPKKIMITVEEV